jgi:hypothetical protein
MNSYSTTLDFIARQQEIINRALPPRGILDSITHMQQHHTNSGLLSAMANIEQQFKQSGLLNIIAKVQYEYKQSDIFNSITGAQQQYEKSGLFDVIGGIQHQYKQSGLLATIDRIQQQHKVFSGYDWTAKFNVSVGEEEDFLIIQQAIIDATDEINSETPSIEQINSYVSNIWNSVIEFTRQHPLSNKVIWWLLGTTFNIIISIYISYYFNQEANESTEADKKEIMSIVEEKARQTQDSMAYYSQQLLNAFHETQKGGTIDYVITNKCKVYNSSRTQTVMHNLVVGHIVHVSDSNKKRYSIHYIPLGDTIPISGWIEKKYAKKISLISSKTDKLFPIRKSE